MILFVSDRDIMDLNNGLESLDLEEDGGEAKDEERRAPAEEAADKDGVGRKKCRRSLRKLIKPAPPAPRLVARPLLLPPGTDTDIAKVYLTKKVKRRPPSLETIFEEPKVTKDAVQYTSVKKFRRAINFGDDGQSRNRVRKRQMKAKRVTARRAAKRVKVSMELFMQKLRSIDDGSDS